MPIDIPKQPNQYPKWMHRAILKPVGVHSICAYSASEKKRALRDMRYFRAFRASLRLHTDHRLAAIERDYQIKLALIAEQEGTMYCLYISKYKKGLAKDLEPMKNCLEQSD